LLITEKGCQNYNWGNKQIEIIPEDKFFLQIFKNSYCKNPPSKVSLRWLGPNFCSIFFHEAVHVKIFFFKFCKNWNLKFKEKSEQLGWMNRKMEKQNLMKVSPKKFPFH
jgi:hypothetical protein